MFQNCKISYFYKLFIALLFLALFRLRLDYQQITMRQFSAGKGKSKSKKALNTSQNEVPKQPQRQSKRFTSASATKVLSIKYFNAKINFVLRNIDDSLAKMLKDVFANQPQIQNYSVLRLLKLPNKHIADQIFNHQIDTKEALASLYHLQAIKSGQVNEMHQISQLIDIIQNYELDDNQIGSELSQEYDERRINFNNEVYNCRKALKTIYQNRIGEIQSSFSQSYDFYRLNFLQSKIEQLSLKLFDEASIGLRQFQSEKKPLVEVIFENPYPSKIYSKNFLKRRIGRPMYLKKKLAFLRSYAYVLRQGLNNTNLIVCHICKNVIRSEYIRCAQRDKKIIQQTHLNSPNIYYKRMIAVDYRYDPTDAVDLHQQLDYYKYYCHPNKRKQCNRVYCIDCIPKIGKIDPKNYFTDYKCDFCSQICTCECCLIAFQLMKTLAHVKSILIKNFQNLLPYQKLINRANFIEKTDPNFKTNFQSRIGFKQAGNQDFKITYEACMQKYEKLFQKISQIQGLDLSHQQLTNPTVSLTPQMIEVRNLFWQLKKLKTQKPKEGKSLQKIYSYYLQEQNKRSEKLTNLAFNQISQVPLKKKYDKEPEAHNIFRKFCIAKDQPKQIPSQTLTKQERQSISRKLFQKFQPVKKEDAIKIIHMKADVAYTEQDYDRMVVAEKYRIHNQREKIYDHLIKKGIFHQIAQDNSFSPVRCFYSHYFQDINDYFSQQKINEQPREEDLNFIVDSSQSQKEQPISQFRRKQAEEGFEKLPFQATNQLLSSKERNISEKMQKNQVLMQLQNPNIDKNQAEIQPIDRIPRQQIKQVQEQESSSIIEQISWKQFMNLQKNSQK